MPTIADPYRPAPYTLDRETAPAFWLVGTLWLPVATGVQTANRFTAIEQVMPAGPGPTTHRHPDMDEGFYVLEGTCEFRALGRTYRADAGTFVHLPRRTPHSFSVDAGDAAGGGARVLNVYTPSGFELVMMSCARPAEARRRPAFEEAPPPAPASTGEVRTLSRLFGQEGMPALPFADPPSAADMATAPLGTPEWSPTAPHVAHTRSAPAYRAFGLEWRLLAGSADTAGTYDLFAVAAPARAGLGARRVGQDEALYVLEGGLTLTLDGVSHAVGAGTFAYVPAGASCAWRAGAAGARLLAFHLPGGFDAAITRYGASDGSAGDDAKVRAYLRAAGTRFEEA